MNGQGCKGIRWSGTAFTYRSYGLTQWPRQAITPALGPRSGQTLVAWGRRHLSDLGKVEPLLVAQTLGVRPRWGRPVWRGIYATKVKPRWGSAHLCERGIGVIGAGASAQASPPYGLTQRLHLRGNPADSPLRMTDREFRIHPTSTPKLITRPKPLPARCFLRRHTSR